MQPLPHRAGFVSIIGKPNVGKSTLMNVLVGEKLSIITSKAQTTRHRIMGILNGTHLGEEFQLVYSDTPGIIKPQYELHKSMMRFVHTSLDDADVLLFVTDIFEQHDEDDVIQKLKHVDAPVLLVINKIDLATEQQLADKITYWQANFPALAVMPISALHQRGTADLFARIVTQLPLHPPYFPKDELTDKPERFFASEIIREKIFVNYKREVPYSCEVVVRGFEEKNDLIVVHAEIMVERESQRAILLGHKGEAIKRVGIEARQEMEKFFGKKIFLQQFVKVEPDWRSKANKLANFGY